MLTDLLRRGGSKIYLGEVDQNIAAATGGTQDGLDTYSLQGKKVFRTANGNLWYFRYLFNSAQHPVIGLKNGIVDGYVSTNNGQTWTLGCCEQWNSSTTNSFFPFSSFFIDQDDYVHCAYVDHSSGTIRYRRGTPNAARTTYVFGAANDVTANEYKYPDIVVHREGTGWKAHLVFSSDTPTLSIYHNIITITAAGAISVATATHIGGSYSTGTHKYPSIDFKHTGDGKTIQGTPDLYCAWAASPGGAGKGIRFKKATYSAGAWTWGTEREIDIGHYCDNENAGGVTCMYDGTRVVIAGFFRDTTGSTTYDLMIYERDAADTTTVTRELISNSSATTKGVWNSFTYDGVGNYYHVAKFDVAGAAQLILRKFHRVTFAIVATTLENYAASSHQFYPIFKKGYSSERIEMVYVNEPPTPFSVAFRGIDTP